MPRPDLNIPRARFAELQIYYYGLHVQLNLGKAACTTDPNERSEHLQVADRYMELVNEAINGFSIIEDLPAFEQA